MKDVQKILVPLDLSGNSLSALEYSSTLCRLFNAEVYLLHVINKIPYETIPTFTDDMKKLYHAEEETAKNKIDKFIEDLKTDLPKVKKVVKWGEPVEEIIKFSGEENIGLIVMTTSIIPGSTKYKLGSVAEKVVELSNAPVMTVKPERN